MPVIRLKANGDKTRHKCRLPPEIEAAQPGVYLRNLGLLVTSLPPRPRGPTPEDAPVVEALRLSVLRHADRLGGVSWVFGQQGSIPFRSSRLTNPG